jgi:hypothetical protein
MSSQYNWNLTLFGSCDLDCAHASPDWKQEVAIYVLWLSASGGFQSRIYVSSFVMIQVLVYLDINSQN